MTIVHYSRPHENTEEPARLSIRRRLDEVKALVDSPGLQWRESAASLDVLWVDTSAVHRNAMSAPPPQAAIAKGPFNFIAGNWMQDPRRLAA